MKILKSIKSNLSRNIGKMLLNRKKYTIENNHYIFADPRGGSTWLSEIIQEITQEPIIWEPLHLGIKDSPFKKIGFDWRQFIPEDEEWQEATELFKLLFHGKIMNEYVLATSTIKECLNSNSLLFKFCRGNQLLPWLTKNFNFNYKPLYLIRHPFAVVASQLHHGAWNEPFNGFRVPNIKFNDIYKEHQPFLKTIKSKEAYLVAIWCIVNQYTLNHSKNNKEWITLTYEEMVLYPKETVKRILNQWNTTYDIDKIVFTKSSKTTKTDSPKETKKRISNWKNKFTDKQFKEMGAVLDYFNVQHYTKDDPFPKITYND